MTSKIVGIIKFMTSTIVGILKFMTCTIVSILKFMTSTNDTVGCPEYEKCFISLYFDINKDCNLHAQVSCAQFFLQTRSQIPGLCCWPMPYVPKAFVLAHLFCALQAYSQPQDIQILADSWLRNFINRP